MIPPIIVSWTGYGSAPTKSGAQAAAEAAWHRTWPGHTIVSPWVDNSLYASINNLACTNNSCGGALGIIAVLSCPARYSLVGTFLGWYGTYGSFYGVWDPLPYCTGSPTTPNPVKSTPGVPPPGLCQGNPINAGAGNKYQVEQDYRSLGPSSLALDRHYNSMLPAIKDQEIGFGNKWTTNLDRRIQQSGNTAFPVVFAHRPDGKVYTFAFVNGAWSGDADIKDGLVELKDAGGNSVGWQYRDALNRSYEEYDHSGRLLRMSSAAGAFQLFTYGSAAGGKSPASAPTCIRPESNSVVRSDLVTCVTDMFGRQIDLAYDGHGMVTEMFDAENSGYGYGHDSGNRLVSLTYPDQDSDLTNNPKRTYHYAEAAHINNGVTCPSGNAFAANLLTGITDENGDRYATYKYDCQGRAISTEHWADSATTQSVERHQLSFTTDANGNPISTVVIDPLGTQRTYGFTTVLGVVKSTGQSQPGGSGCGPSSSSISYDTNGNVASRTDFAGHKSCFEYDLGRNLETKRVEGLAASAACASALSTPPAPTTANPVRTINSAWHPDWRLEIKRAEPTKLTHWIYNGQPDPTAGNAIASCAPASALLPDGKPIAVLCKKVEQATLDDTGAQGFAATVSGVPRVWQYTYNGYGKITSEDRPRTDISDRTTYTYYADTAFDETQAHTMGDLWKSTNALNQITEYTRYDKHGRALQIRDANGVVTHLSYSPRGWLTSKQVGSELTTYDYDKVGQLKKLTLPDGSFIAYDYDAAHRLREVSDQRGNRIAYTLDAAGNRTKEEIKDPQGQLVKTLTRVPDALGRVQSVQGVGER